MNNSNHCSIKLLEDVYIGAGVRMTSGKGTIPFKNVPMTGMKIEKYDKQGFFLHHENLPKKIWVDFKQLPLTRLQINNGVISDEITFVENIVLHQMQLIRTLDTEYIELLYNEKQLQNKINDIIPVSSAVIGDWYKGAQCKEGLEMVYLGSWYTKSLATHRPSQKLTYHLRKESPYRAYFACKEGNKWDVINFPVTNKKIKDLICLHKSEEIFKDKDNNKEIIIVSGFPNSSSTLESENYKKFFGENYPKPSIFKDLKLSTYGKLYQYLSEKRENIDIEAYNFINGNFDVSFNTEKFSLSKFYAGKYFYGNCSTESIAGI